MTDIMGGMGGLGGGGAFDVPASNLGMGGTGGGGPFGGGSGWFGGLDPLEEMRRMQAIQQQMQQQQAAALADQMSGTATAATPTTVGNLPGGPPSDYLSGAGMTVAPRPIGAPGAAPPGAPGAPITVTAPMPAAAPPAAPNTEPFGPALPPTGELSAWERYQKWYNRNFGPGTTGAGGLGAAGSMGRAGAGILQPPPAAAPPMVQAGRASPGQAGGRLPIKPGRMDLRAQQQQPQRRRGILDG